MYDYSHRVWTYGAIRHGMATPQSVDMWTRLRLETHPSQN